MELRQIRSFLSITEALHSGRTAQIIHLSQPALSLQVQALEDEIGVRLFERNQHSSRHLPAERLEDWREVERERDLGTKGLL